MVHIFFFIEPEHGKKLMSKDIEAIIDGDLDNCLLRLMKFL